MSEEEMCINGPLECGHLCIGCPVGVLTDGHGNNWVNYCVTCKERGTLEVVRPGRSRCRKCGE